MPMKRVLLTAHKVLASSQQHMIHVHSHVLSGDSAQIGKWLVPPKPDRLGEQLRGNIVSTLVSHLPRPFGHPPEAVIVHRVRVDIEAVRRSTGSTDQGLG